MRALSELKQNGRKTGRLRFKGKGWYKMPNFTQSGFGIVNGWGRRCRLLRPGKIGNVRGEKYRETEQLQQSPLGERVPAI